MFYPEATVQSQYAASPTIRALVDGFNDEIDPRADIGLFREKIFDVLTAEGVGLDIWGRIVALPRSIHVTDNSYWLGFRYSLLQTFGHGVFWNDLENVDNFEVEDAAYRALIMWKAAANISTADAAALNKLLNILFPGRNCYVLETGVMALRVVTEFAIESFYRSFFLQYGLIAKGAGVEVNWLEVPMPTLGFAGTGLYPFNEGLFFSGTLIEYQ